MDLEEIVDVVTDILNDILNESAIDFRNDRGDFKIRYEGEKFYLLRIAGNYEYSLQWLIQLILHEEGVFRRILNDKQTVELQRILHDDSMTIYQPYELYDLLSSVYYFSIAFVGNKLTKLGFDVENYFIEEGFGFTNNPSLIKDNLLLRIQNNVTSLDIEYSGEWNATDIIQFVTKLLNSIINKQQKYFTKDEQEFCINYECFLNDEYWLSRLDNDSYDTLPSLIFVLMSIGNVFEKILNVNQLTDLQTIINQYIEENDRLYYRPNQCDSSNKELCLLLSKVEYESINFVYNKLSKWGYDVEAIFSPYLSKKQFTTNNY